MMWLQHKKFVEKQCSAKIFVIDSCTLFWKDKLNIQLVNLDDYI